MKILGWAENAGVQQRAKNKKSPAIHRGTLVKNPIAVKGCGLLPTQASRHLGHTPGLKGRQESSVGSQDPERL